MYNSIVNKMAHRGNSHRWTDSNTVFGFSFPCLVLLLSTSFANTHFASSEPVGSVSDPCICDILQGGVFVSCKGKGLDRVPTCIPISVRYLDLSGNQISNLPAGVFEDFCNLVSLTVNHNVITHVHNGSFTGLGRLLTLDLSFNSIRYEDSFASEAFVPLTSIETLYIQGNCYSDSNWKCYYPDMALSKAVKLRYLYLDGLKNSRLGAGFRHLKHLQTLIMSDYSGYCKLGQVPQNMFWDLRETSLTFLGLYNCEISQIMPNSLSGLSNLQTLVIWNDPKMRPGGIQNITIGLNTTRIKTLNLTDLWLNPYFDQFPASMFEGIQNTSLEHLDLSGNKLLTLDPKCIFNLPKTLRYFSLSRNIIGDPRFLRNIIYLANVEELDISYQSYVANTVTIRPMPKMSNDSNINNVLNDALKRIGFHLYQNNTGANKTIRTQSDALISQMYNMQTSYHVDLPPKLKILQMYKIKLDPFLIPPVTFGTNELAFINASGCLLSAFLGPWTGLDHLHTLDLSDNGMSYVKHAFDGFDNLTMLYFARNKIGKTIEADTKCETFKALAKLQLLDLGDNVIASLPQCMFQTLRSLLTLSLANNSLTNIEFHMDSLLNLKYLNLANNQLSTLTDKNIADFDKIAQHTSLSIDLEGNKLKCDCENRHWIEWMISSKIHIFHRINLVCIYKNGSIVKLSRLPDIRDKLNNDCDAWVIVTAAAVTFVGLILMLGFIAILCYKKVKYMYLFRSGHKTLNPYHRLKGENVIVSVDAYLSYDGDYEVFGTKTLHEVIANDIYPSLKRKGIRLLIRDELTSGQMLNILISEAIRKSHKVVVFLTSEFRKEFANMHEFHVAAHEGIYTNRRMIIPVFVGEVKKTDLSADMLAYLQSEKIAHFPVDEHCISDFINYLEDRILQW